MNLIRSYKKMNDYPVSIVGNVSASLSSGNYYLFISPIQITLIAFSLNLILNSYPSRKFKLTAHNLITLFGVDSLLIELDKCLTLFHVTYISMMFRLVKDVITYFYYIGF